MMWTLFITFLAVCLNQSLNEHVLAGESSDTIIKTVQQRIGNREVSPGPIYAFSAMRLYDTTVQAGETLVFDGATTNLGQAYNTARGKFTCPVDGVYFFTVNILSYINRLFDGHIVLDGRAVAGVYSVGANSNADDQSTASVVIHCSQGQQVWVKSLKHSYINGERTGFTQFTGFLLAEDGTSGVYAFSAHMVNDTLFDAGQALIFDKAETDIGHQYNKELGKFTCPTNGVYFFTVNILSQTNNYGGLDIVLNNKQIAAIANVGANPSTHDQSTASVIIHCTEGQQVWVKARWQSHVNGEQVGYTQFTGFLLPSDSSANINSEVASPTIAFSAYRQHDYNVGAGAVIQFDAAQTNIGQSYDASTGKFTCPVDGVYFFTVNILSHVNHYLRAHINVGSRHIASVYSVGASPSLDDQSSTAAVTHCSAGEIVYVQNIYAAPINGEVIPQTQFSGFLISADKPAQVVG